jgi:hypothetical protein
MLYSHSFLNLLYNTAWEVPGEPGGTEIKWSISSADLC